MNGAFSSFYFSFVLLSEDQKDIDKKDIEEACIVLLVPNDLKRSSSSREKGPYLVASITKIDTLEGTIPSGLNHETSTCVLMRVKECQKMGSSPFCQTGVS